MEELGRACGWWLMCSASDRRMAATIVFVDAMVGKLCDTVAKLDGISENEKAGFVSLVSRYLSGEADQIEWSKIQTPADELVVPYYTLVPTPEEEVESGRQ